jgi:hypothetical protein
MFGLPEWALGAGVITIALFTGIGLMIRLLPASATRGKRRLAEDQAATLEGVQQRLDELEEAQLRVAELEERLAFTERLLARPREKDRED